MILKTMANHASAQKRIRQTIAKTRVNNERRSKVKTVVKKLSDAIAKKDKKLSVEAFRNAESAIMSGVSKGIFKKETAARKVSRLSKLLKKSFS